MNHNDQNDPRITAYALGELQGNDKIEIEKLINDYPELAEYVQSLRATAEHLTAALQPQVAPKLTDTQHQTIMEKAMQQQQQNSEPTTKWTASLFAIAAAVLLGVTIWLVQNRPPQNPDQTTPNNPIANANDGLVEITIDLPNPQFTGTPKDLSKLNIKVDLENPESKRPPLRVPKGVVLLSLDKPVTGSEDMPMIGELEQITDGDKEATGSSYVELPPEPQWVQIDLEKPAEIWGIVIWHYHSSARIYRDVIVQLADDEDFTQNVRTIFNNDYDNSSGKGVGQDYEYFDEYVGKLIRAKGQKARYIRCYSNGNTDNDQNNYIEIEIYGKPIK